MKNKTGRKNKINRNTVLPINNFFTIKDVFAANPSDSVQITMRTHMKDFIGEGKVKDIGVIHNGKGRPTNVYSLVPVTDIVIDSAKKAGVILHSEYITTKVADIKSISSNHIDESVTNHVEVATLVAV